MSLLTRPAPPWPPAPYRLKTGTHHCRCIPPHDCPHNATQNPSWRFPPVCLFCTRDFPGEHSIAQSGYHKKDFQPFSQTFYAKSSVCYPSLLTPFAATFLGNRVFGSPRSLHPSVKTAFLENKSSPSAAFPQETGSGAAVFRHDPFP